MATKNFVCKETCFYSGSLKEYKQDVSYELSDAEQKEYKSNGFMSHFKEDITAVNTRVKPSIVVPAVPEKE